MKANVERNKKSVLLFWMVLGLAVVMSQVAQPVVAKTTTKVEQAAQADDDSPEQQQIKASKDLAVNSLTGLNLNQELYQIREIVLNDVTDPHVVHFAQKLTETDHFKTLFRKVISTNAP